MLYLPPRVAIRRTSAVWLRRSKAVPRASSWSTRRRFTVPWWSEPDVVEVLGRRQPEEELDDGGIPRGDVDGQRFQHGRGHLAPSEADRVGDVCPSAPQLPLKLWVEWLISHQVGDVRDRPLGTRLDELVVVELVDVLFESRDLLGDDCSSAWSGPRRRFRSSSKSSSCCAVSRPSPAASESRSACSRACSAGVSKSSSVSAIAASRVRYTRQEAVDGLQVEAHDPMTPSCTGRGSSSSSSAATVTSVPARGT